MHSGQGSSSADGRGPVFVFPHALTFYADDQTSHKQVLTLYNPHDFPLQFHVLSTAPRKYVVVDSEGTIRPRCCLDIVIRHIAITPSNYGITDKFRIKMHERGHNQLFGRKDVSASLLATKPDYVASATSDTDHFEQLIPQSHSHQRGQQYSIGGEPVHASTGPNLIFILVAIVCIAALMLPTEGQIESSTLPAYLKLSLHQKLIFAYALGLVTMVILRQ